MNTQFKFGALIGGILLGQLQITMIVLILIGTHFFPDFSFIFNLVAIVFGIIGIVGHIKAGVSVVRDFDDPTVVEKELPPPKNFKEAFDLTRNPAFLGIAWRFSEEWKYMRQVASFNFKFN